MKRKTVIIIISCAACVLLLAGLVVAYFCIPLPISYAGTSEKCNSPSVDEHKLILPTEAQASLINSDMSWAEVIDTIGLPQKDYGSGIYIFEFYLRDGHRLWIYTDGFRIGNTSDIVHSDYPYQTYEDYLERKYKEKDSAFAVTPWNNMYGTAANSLPDAA